jgi:hypothetical protein
LAKCSGLKRAALYNWQTVPVIQVQLPLIKSGKHNHVYLVTLKKNYFMKRLLVSLLVVAALQQATYAQLTTVADGGNKKAIVGERIGLTDVTIHYDRPAVKGREGKIWGELVPYGLTDLGFGSSKAAPWRAGANENTTIHFSTPVTVQGKPVAAGTYALFIELGKEASTLILSKNSTSWGSYFYNPSEDALRVPVKQQVVDRLVERLKYEFVQQTENSATVALQWEKLLFAFTIETDVKQQQLQSFRNELRSDKGFDWRPWVQAANWCADNNTNLEEALTWAEYGVNGKYIGEKNFTSLSTKARILGLLNRQEEAAAVMAEALPLGNMQELHNYGRQLLNQKKSKEAAAVFKANYKKYPAVYTTNMGMARALSSEAKYKDALKFATAALAQAPDEDSKKSINSMMEKLKAGTDINE